MSSWYNKSIEDIQKNFNTNIENGLSKDQIKKNREEYGVNKLQKSKGRTPLQMFIDQFKNVLVIILLVSALISIFLGEVNDAVVITVILLINATLGVIQEYKAEKSLDALKEMAAPEAIVIREGNQQEIAAEDIVAGDIVMLEAGDYIPADIRLIEESDMKIEESALTGESVPVEKDIELITEDRVSVGDQHNMAFMGTAVTYGRGKGIVTATGMETQMGEIADMLKNEKREPTPLQKRLDKMGRQLGIITLIVVALVVVVGLLRGIEFFDIFMTGISLAVAAVPEGLPAVVTIVLALGVQRMIKKHAIIRRLPAVETLGAITIICSDKTGTLTQNEMTVKQIYLPDKNIEIEGEGYKPEGEFFYEKEKYLPDENDDLSLLLKAGALCNNSELKNNEENNKIEIIGDPTEASLVVVARKAGYNKSELENNYQRIKELPFDSKRKRMSTINKTPENKVLAFIKGAPDELLKLCNTYYQDGKPKEMTKAMKEKIMKQNEEYASQALRVLAVAFKDVSDYDQGKYNIDLIENDLTFLGLTGMIDPPRSEVADSVQTCKKAGIRPVMITGDYPVTARAIASELGIFKEGDGIITGNELEDISDQDLEKTVMKTTVFARVSPKHKSRIVQALQKNSQVVSMTGDGVNDAPALKQADIGVAMGITGTDVSKEAADMVLTDDNFTSIVAAVEEGRSIYSNIKKFIRFLLSCNVGEIIALLLAIVIGLPRPLIPIQILWVNLVTDGFPALALGVDPATENLMNRPPRDPAEGIFVGKMAFNILTQGTYIGLITLVAFFIGLKLNSLAVARTMAFGTLSLSQLWQSLNSRSEEHSLFKIGFFTNKYLILAILFSGSLQLGVMFIPFLQNIFKVVSLSTTNWVIVLIIAFSPIIFVEVLKLSYQKYGDETNE